MAVAVQRRSNGGFHRRTHSAGTFVNALQGDLGGCLTSDGYAVYRSYLNRIRCLAHLLREARAGAEGTCQHTSQVGQQLLDLLGGVMQATKAARNGSHLTRTTSTSVYGLQFHPGVDT